MGAQLARFAYYTVPLTGMAAGWMAGVEFAKISWAGRTRTPGCWEELFQEVSWVCGGGMFTRVEELLSSSGHSDMLISTLVITILPIPSCQWLIIPTCLTLFKILTTGIRLSGISTTGKSTPPFTQTSTSITRPQNQAGRNGIMRSNFKFIRIVKGTSVISRL